MQLYDPEVTLNGLSTMETSALNRVTLCCEAPAHQNISYCITQWKWPRQEDLLSLPNKILVKTPLFLCSLFSFYSPDELRLTFTFVNDITLLEIY
jgi:hypothetical protein